MSMLRTILIDDEPKALAVLKSDLETYCSREVHVVAYCQTPLQALSALRKQNPDLVFLDIGLEGHEMDGFGLLEVFGKITFDLVLVTGNSEHAVHAFEFGAIDFLLKPFSPQELRRAVQRVLDRRSPSQLPILREWIEHCEERYKEEDQIAIPTQGCIWFKNQRLMKYCIADGSCTHIFSADKERPLVITKRLGEFSGVLSQQLFFRIHHSHIVNRHYIQKYKKANGGSVTMQDGRELEVSRSKKQSFQRWLGLQD